MRTNIAIGKINIPDYVISCIQKTCHTNEISLKKNSEKNLKMDKEKSNKISRDSSFEEILQQKMHSMEKK